MEKPDLLNFLQNQMSMTDVYQPVIIRELLLFEGMRTKADLATSIAAYDLSIQEYYERIVMRWPKTTLTKHGIVEYQRKGSHFHLLPYPDDPELRGQALYVCNEKISTWLDRKRTREKAPEAGASVRYEVLKEAGEKCQLCGISSAIRPIDIDHIVPRSKANKNGKVLLHDKLIGVNDRNNLQALCFSCNRAKRDTDQTDFRRTQKLVRDRIPELIEAEGRKPRIKVLTGHVLTASLYDKLTEEHVELLEAKDAISKCEELADLVEVIIALAKQFGMDEAEFLKSVKKKRADRGAFSKGYFYQGDE